MPDAIFPAGRSGLADTPPQVLGQSVMRAWDAFLDLVAATDLERPSRLTGLSGRDVLVHLGSWPDNRVVEGLLASARAGAVGTPTSLDETNAQLLAAHRGATTDEVVAALHRGRADLAAFFGSPEAVELGRALARSTAGPLPVLTLLNAGTFELAVHALDLAPCGAPPPAPHLLDSGLSALVDITGGLANRAGVDLLLAAQTPDGGWAFDSRDGGWSTGPLSAGSISGVGVSGTAADMLEGASGRVALPQLLITRRLVVHHLAQWMHLAPLLDDVPGLPGGAALKTAVTGMSGVAGGVGRVLGRLRR